MRKPTIIILMLLVFAGISSAQGLRLGVAGNVVFPTSDLKEVAANTGWGVDAFGVFDLMKLNITARTGYYDFGIKDHGLFETHYKAIPILVGLRFDAPVIPGGYAGLEMGLHAFTINNNNRGTQLPTNSETSRSEFSVSPNIGVAIAGFDVSAYYMWIKTGLSYYGIRVGYGLGI